MSAPPGPWPPAPWPSAPRPPAPPPSRTGDRIATAALLVTAWVLVLGGGAMMGVLLAYLGSCLPSRCSGGAQAVSQAALVVGVLGVLVATVLAIVRSARRARAWPVAVGAVGVAVAMLLLAAVAYVVAATGLS